MRASIQAFTCPRCGWTQDDYRATGLFRCKVCLNTALGMTQYRSETDESDEATPEPRGTMPRLLADCRIALRVAIKEERYEDAAVLRDALSFFQTRLSERSALHSQS